MLIRFLKSVAGIGFAYRPNQVVDLPDAAAVRWVAAGLAAPVDDRETAAVSQPETAAAPKPKPRKRR